MIGQGSSAVLALGKRLVRHLGILPLAAGLLAGCAGFVPQPGPGTEPAGAYVALTTPFIAVGDTQEHHSTGLPLLSNDSAIDSYVEVAQRPPEQPLFGRRIVEWVLQHHRGEPFLHLGDLLDISCRSEARRIGQVLRAGNPNGAILPGNHDGLMFGIFGYPIHDSTFSADARNWNRACQLAARPEDRAVRSTNDALSRREFIRLYLDGQLAGIRKPGLTPPPHVGTYAVQWRNPDRNAFLAGIRARLVDVPLYADSFLAQQIRPPRAPGATREVVIIGLDTNQAGPLASAWDTLLGRSPGSEGHVRPDQLQAVTPWVEEAAAKGTIVVFAGHHNWNALGIGSRVLLRGLMQKVSHPLVYLSAHTHRGFWAVHRLPGQRPLLEMNVSSLSDWPIAYRRISFAYDEAAQRILVRADLMPRGNAPPRTDADLLAAWENQTCAVSGLPTDEIRDADRTVVEQQRAARGSVLGWLVAESTGSLCGPCQESLYEHASEYANEMLRTVLQASEAMRAGRVAWRLPADLALPAWCEGRTFYDCARAVMAERASGLQGHASLFRRRAELVSVINDYFDRIEAPGARAYMTCRAVQGAVIDFNATSATRNDNRSEANRIAEQFFRNEASIGLD